MKAIEILDASALATIPLPDIILERPVFSIQASKRVFFGKPGSGKSTALRYVLQRDAHPGETIVLINRWFDSEALNAVINEVKRKEVLLVWDDADPQLLLEATARMATYVDALRVMATSSQKIHGFRCIELKELDREELEVFIPSLLEQMHITVESDDKTALVDHFVERANPFLITSFLSFYRGTHLRREDMLLIPASGEELWQKEYLSLSEEEKKFLTSLALLLTYELPATMATIHEVHQALHQDTFSQMTVQSLHDKGWIEKVVDEYRMHRLQLSVVPIGTVAVESLALSPDLRYELLLNAARKHIFTSPSFSLGLLKRALALKRTATILNLIGVAYINLGDIPNAKEYLEQSLALFPSPGAYFNKGVAHLHTQEYEHAIVAFEHALELNPHNPLFLINKGIALMGLHRFEEAAEACQAAARIFEHPAAYQLLGNALHAMGRIDDAIVAYRTLLALEPTGKNYALLGNAYLQKEMFREALDAYDQAVLLEPSAETYAERGVAALRMGDKEKARASFIRAFEYDPMNEKANVNFALLLVAEEDYARALEHLEKLNEKEERDYLLYHIALVSLAMNNKEKALTAINKAIAKQPKKEYLHLRASIEFQQEHYEQALSTYEEILAHNPQDLVARIGQGLCYLQLSVYEKAIDAFTQALMIEETPQLYNLRGLAHLLWGEYDLALKDIDRSLASLKTSNAYANKALCLLAIDEYDGAIENAQQALALDAQNPKPYHIIGLAKVSAATKLEEMYRKTIGAKHVVEIPQEITESIAAERGEGIRMLAEASYKYLFNGIMQHAIEALEEIRKQPVVPLLRKLHYECLVLLAASKEITGRTVEDDLMQEIKNHFTLLDEPYQILAKLVEARLQSTTYDENVTQTEKSRELEHRIREAFNNRTYDDLDGIVYKTKDEALMVLWWLVLNILKENAT